MKKKIILGIIVMLTIQISFISCNKSNNEVKESKFYSVTIDGNKKYISEDNEESKEIEEFVKLFIEYAVAVDYKKVDYSKEMNLYGKSFRETLEEMDYVNLAKEEVESSELVIKVNSYELKKAEIHNVDGNDSVKVYVDYKYTYEHATDDFIANLGCEIGKSEDKSIYLDLIKENGEWKVVSSGIIDDDSQKSE